MKRLLVVLAIAIGLTVCQALAVELPSRPWLSACYDGRALRFASGFEGTFPALPDQQGTLHLFGSGDIDACGGKGSATLPSTFSLGPATIQFEGGTESERRAAVIAAPDNPRNHVLQFWLQSPNVRDSAGMPEKGRIQMNIYGSRGVRHVWQKVRMYLHEDFKHVTTYPRPVDWLTISEWWNNVPFTGEAYPFRITVNLIKPQREPGGRLFLGVHAQTFDVATRRFRPVWSRDNQNFEVPLGKWLTVEYEFVEGRGVNGRFFLAITPEGGTRTVIFDVRDSTHHPDDPSPDGLSHFNPLKLYTSGQLINHVRERGGTLQILWDDLELTASDR